MQIDFKVKMNANLFVKDPETTETGKQIVRTAVKMLSEIGYEQFTFKKLATEIDSTEATVYRYFINKHKLLVYLVDWYWAYLEFQVIFQLNNVISAEEKIKKAVKILVSDSSSDSTLSDLDIQSLFYIAIAEGSKTYLTKDVDEHNKDLLYKPYKDLCSRIAGLFKEYNPKYKYANSLASTVIEASRLQHFFMHHLPRLSDFSKKKNPKDLELFLQQMIFSSLT